MSPEWTEMEKKMNLRIGLIAAVVTGLGGPVYAQDGNGNAQSIATACMVETNMPDGICICVGKRAVEDLGENGQLFLHALIVGNKDAADALRPQLPADQLIAASMFMVSVPQDCAR